MPPFSRSQCREWALQVLYQAEFSGRPGEEVVLRFWRHFHRRSKPPAYLQELVFGVQAHQAEVDGLIARYSEHWRLERMAAVDRNLLRLGAYELLYQPGIPAKVVLNEAVELAKRYGSEGSGAFVNGLLDRIREAVGRKP
ncbi:MAG: transcription antitermination factor NusB [Deltaproteobacteria bacterium]|nr:transcription antitermination factor NusB [Deltaproteobacteria bacterium]